MQFAAVIGSARARDSTHHTHTPVRAADGQATFAHMNTHPTHQGGWLAFPYVSPYTGVFPGALDPFLAYGKPSFPVLSMLSLHYAAAYTQRLA